MKKKEIKKAFQELFYKRLEELEPTYKSNLPDFITEVGRGLYEVNSGTGMVIRTNSNGVKLFMDALQKEVKKNNV